MPPNRASSDPGPSKTLPTTSRTDIMTEYLIECYERALAEEKSSKRGVERKRILSECKESCISHCALVMCGYMNTESEISINTRSTAYSKIITQSIMIKAANFTRAQGYIVSCGVNVTYIKDGRLYNNSGFIVYTIN